MNKTPLYIGAAAILAGGVAFAALQATRAEQADVLKVEPIVTSEVVYADVLNAEAVTELVTGPRQVCQDVQVQTRLPERDGDVGGTVAGAVIGGLIGNQVGGGKGRQAATVAGAVAGGFAGREIDRRHVGGRVVTGSETRCETITEARQQVVGYEISYRTAEGENGQLRSAKKPGARVSLGPQERIVGYNVTYRYNDVERTIRMQDDPGDSLPVVEGKVVTATDTPDATPRG